MMSKSKFYFHHGALSFSILCSTVLKQSMFICMLCHSIYIKLCMYICFIIISVLVLILLRCKLWWRIPFTFFVLILFSFIFLFAFCCFCWCWVVATGAAVAVAIYNKFFSAVVWYYYEMPSIGPFFPTAQIQKKKQACEKKNKSL